MDNLLLSFVMSSAVSELKLQIVAPRSLLLWRYAPAQQSRRDIDAKSGGKVD